MVRADALTPIDVLRTAWRYLHVAIAAGLILGALTYGYTLLLDDKYTATTLVLVEDTGLSRDYVRSTVTQDLEARLRTLSAQVMSRTRLEEVMGRFSLYDNEPEPREDRLLRMRNRIDVDVSRADAFRISFTHTDPVTAMEVTNALAGLFIRDSARAVSSRVETASSLLTTQLEELRGRLDEKEREISAFKIANPGMLPEQLQANLRTLDRLERELSDNARALSSARDRQTTLEQIVNLDTGSGSPLTARQRARQVLADGSSDDSVDTRLASQPPSVRLEGMKLQREALLARYTERHPDVQLLNTKISSLERRIADGSVAGDESIAALDADPSSVGGLGPRGQLTAVRREVAGLLEDRKGTQASIAEYETRIAVAPRVEQELRELERDQRTLQSSYDDLQERVLGADLVGTLERTDPTARFHVIDPAVVPERKSSPQRLLFLLGGCFAGFALGVAAGVAREMIWQPIHGADEVERFIGVKVLSTIPRIDTPAARRRRMARWLLSSAAVASVVAAVFILSLVLRPQ